MSESVWLLLIFLLLLAVEGAFNSLAGLWSVFWVPLELVFDAIFFLSIMAVIFLGGGGSKGRTRE
jgi:hypothetical protein